MFELNRQKINYMKKGFSSGNVYTSKNSKTGIWIKTETVNYDIHYPEKLLFHELLGNAYVSKTRKRIIYKNWKNEEYIIYKGKRVFAKNKIYFF